MRIARAIAADSANVGDALVEGGKSAVLTITTLRVTSAPRIVLGIGMGANPCDAGEKRGHEEESLHGAYSVWAAMHRNPGPRCFNPLQRALDRDYASAETGIYYLTTAPFSALQ